MAKNNNFLLIVALAILLAIVAFFFGRISGLVAGGSAVPSVVLNKDKIEFNQFDGSHVVGVMVNPGVCGVMSNFAFTSAADGVIKTENLCDASECHESINKNFIIERSDSSGRGPYYFEFDLVRSDLPECQNFGNKLRSPVFTISNV